MVELSIVIPALNEEKTIVLCVTKAKAALQRLGIEGEVVVDGPRMWTRTIQIGGNNFTEALVKAFKLSFAKAEKLKPAADNATAVLIRWKQYEVNQTRRKNLEKKIRESAASIEELRKDAPVPHQQASREAVVRQETLEAQAELKRCQAILANFAIRLTPSIAFPSSFTGTPPLNSTST